MLEKLAEQGITPKALEDRPDLEDHLRYPWEVFNDLSRERPSAFSGICYIPLESYLHYANLYQFTLSDTQRLWKLVRVLDRYFVDYHHKRQEAARAAEKRKAKKP